MGFMYDNAAELFLDPVAHLTITNITAANPGEVTTQTHGLVNGDKVTIQNVAGDATMQSLVNDLVFTVTVTGATTFTIGIDTTTGSYTSGGECTLADAALKRLPSVVRLLQDDIKAILIDVASYTAVKATHAYLSDVAVAARIATSGNLTSKTVTDGVFDAADITLSSVSNPGSDQVDQILLYKDTGEATESPLIYLLDSADVTGLPFTPPNGSDVTIDWDDGGGNFDGIFRLLSV